jgi:hypothetical protein
MANLCACGCGQENTIPTRVYHKGIGYVKDGPPRPFINHHSNSSHHQKRGRKSSPEYNSYSHAKDHCTNPNAHWADYGGRGIQFLFTSFEQFFAELGPRPAGTTLDRFPNNDGNYEPGNVRWATREEQNQNRRSKRAA